MTKLWTVLVKRRLFLDPPNDRDTLELHGFRDSSGKRYGGAIFISESAKSKQVHAKLYSAKWRFVPSKGLSIPWLELLACLLLSE